jgi:preprotein translocase subunit SecY
VVLLKNFKNIFLIPELVKKLVFTIGVLIIYRLGSVIPVAGINASVIEEYMKQQSLMGGLLKYIEVFSGGALSQATLFALGVGPYITSSIMMQILTMSIPSLELLSKEGEYGRKQINQYTRYLTVFIAIGQALGYAFYLESIPNLVATPGLGFKALFVLSLTVGSLFVMWLGEQIYLFGIGSGSSMILFAGIVARFPNQFFSSYVAVQSGQYSIVTALFYVAVYAAIAACIVFLEKGDRKIPVQYARRVVGNRVYGGQSTYIPFKINSAGVMPVIFAGSVLQLPMFLASMLSGYFDWLKVVKEALMPTHPLYNALEFALIIGFSFLYTAMIFNPVELADTMKKNGGFIPGIRPGVQTANYFDYILNRIGLVGAIYLGFLAITPNVLQMFFPFTTFFLGGTTILIVVGVALEVSSQIESYLIEHRYEGFLSSGRIKNRVNR